MEVSRGAVVLAAGPGDFSGKPRPFLVVQSDLFNAAHASVTLLPVTSVASGNTMFRVAVSPTPDNGLLQDSEAQVDKIQTLRRSRVVRVVGRAAPTVMEQIDQALRRWLAL